MNFAYIDTQSILEQLLAPVRRDVAVQAIPCELDETWKSFEETLGKFKMEFALARNTLTQKTKELNEKRNDLYTLQTVSDNLVSDDLKERVVCMTQEYETNERVADLIQECGELTGRVEAMKRVLMDTCSERYAKFTCFICMDKLVDLYIDPCGHLVCETCWSRTTNKETCPGCRTRIYDVKKMYSLS